MSNIFKIILFFLLILSLIFSASQLNKFRIDASSDTLVAQNDKDFEYFNYYQKIFPTKNNLVVAIKSLEEIDKELLGEIEILSNKISKLNQVDTVFNINKAPILFLNNRDCCQIPFCQFEYCL